MTDNSKKTTNDETNSTGAGEGPATGAKLSGEMLTAQLLALLKNWSGYGYELAKRLEETGYAGCNSGTLYRTLRQMEKSGLISSAWDTSRGGPARRMYSMTEAGNLFLDNWISLIDFHKKSLNMFLDASAMMLEASKSFQRSATGTNREAEKPDNRGDEDDR